MRRALIAMSAVLAGAFRPHGGTAEVPYDSAIKRKGWMHAGMVKDAHKSFWAPFTGQSSQNIVYQSTNDNAKEGHTVTFDYNGFLVNGPSKGKETAYGKGEIKRKFSNSLTVDRYRFPVNNGDAFDGVDIGDLSLTQHSTARDQLTDKWNRFKDQGLFDAAQQQATHVIASTTFTFDDFLAVEDIIKTGVGYTTGAKRLPLRPFMLMDGKPIWLMVIDSSIKRKLLGTGGAQTMFSNADVRGNENRLISGSLGKVGNFLVVEANSFFGTQLGSIIDSDGYSGINNIAELSWAGLRQYKDNGTNFTPDLWSGETGFDASVENLTSRGLILGAGALQNPFGLAPDYKIQSSNDFEIDSESMMQVWTNFRTTSLTAENLDYDTGIGGISHGVIALDIQI